MIITDYWPVIPREGGGDIDSAEYDLGVRDEVNKIRIVTYDAPLGVLGCGDIDLVAESLEEACR